MGVGFYSKIRSGVSSDSASINDIYQKLKEGIVGFSVADVLEDRISNLIEPMKIIEVFRLHSSFLPEFDDMTVIESVVLFKRFKTNSILLPSIPSNIYGQDIPIKSGESTTYNNQTFIIPDYGVSPSLGRLRSKSFWFVVKGDFIIKNHIDVLICNQDSFGTDYNATDGNFHVINLSFVNFSPDEVSYNIDLIHNGTLTDIGFSDQIRESITLDGEYKAIFEIQTEDGADNNNPITIANGIYVINNMEFGLFGNGRIEASSRLPMYIA